MVKFIFALFFGVTTSLLATEINLEELRKDFNTNFKPTWRNTGNAAIVDYAVDLAEKAKKTQDFEQQQYFSTAVHYVLSGRLFGFSNRTAIDKEASAMVNAYKIARLLNPVCNFYEIFEKENPYYSNTTRSHFKSLETLDKRIVQEANAPYLEKVPSTVIEQLTQDRIAILATKLNQIYGVGHINFQNKQLTVSGTQANISYEAIARNLTDNPRISHTTGNGSLSLEKTVLGNAEEDTDYEQNYFDLKMVALACKQSCTFTAPKRSPSIIRAITFVKRQNSSTGEFPVLSGIIDFRKIDDIFSNFDYLGCEVAFAIRTPYQTFYSSI